MRGCFLPFTPFLKEETMSDKMRWRYGDTNPVIAAVAAATVIEIGDLLWQDADNAKPASLFAVVNNKPVDQAAFTAKFLGVAMARSRQGDTAPIRVATTGVFELECAAATFELGDMMGVDAGAGAALLNQQVVKVAASRDGDRAGRQAAADRRGLRAGRCPFDRDDRRRRSAAIPSGA